MARVVGLPTVVTSQVDTDLYDLAKAGTAPCSVTLSADGASMAVLAKDKRVRVFDFRRGKLRRAFDESLQVRYQITFCSFLFGC